VAPITAAERAMLDFAVQVTTDATRMSRDDVEGLRRHGFDDRAVLQITLIASWFNYINRVADALGVGRDDAAGEALPIPAEAPWKA
jgi:alkylhydroperoxidase family enzyme